MLIALIFMALPFAAKAQDKVEASVGADVVSSYIWRGQELGGASIQPSVSLSYKGLSLEAWGNVGIDREDTKEFDLLLTYETGGLTIGLTDYWTDAHPKYFHYGAHNTGHVFNARIGYDFGPVAFMWDTNFAGADGVKANGKRAYSSYLELTAPFTLGGLDWTAGVGITPWESDYYYTTGFAVCDLQLQVAKEIKLTDHFSLPLFALISMNPVIEETYFAFGISF